MSDQRELSISVRPTALSAGRHFAIAIPLQVFVIGSAYISVPLPVGPVPMTLQSLAVLLVGVWGGAWIGAAVCATYVTLGVLGLPVFAGGAVTPGLTFLAMPTAGYLLAFVVASFFAGRLVESVPNRWFGAVAAMLVGHVVIFAGGLAWLSAFLGVEKAVAVGFAPFIVGSLLKIALGTTLVVATSRLKRGA